MEEEEALLGSESTELTALPFYMTLRDPLTVGNAIIIKGFVLENATTFAVNFCSTISCCLFRYTEGKDIAFSLRPHFDRRCIVRNSTHKLKWQEEEVAGNQDFPLSRKSDFCIEIYIAVREFFVAINGVHFCSFVLRTALNSIHSVEIVGDLKIDGVSINSSQEVYPSQSIPSEVQIITNAINVTNFDNNLFNCRDFKLPLTFALSNTLQSGNVIKIQGRVKMLPYSFLINLQSSESKLPSPNIQLHVNGRYNYTPKKSKNLLVLNSWINDAWGIEKTLTNGSLPMPGNDFVITIICEEDHFKVHTQEDMALDFPYRSSLQGVKVIHIRGDIFVHAVTFS